MRIRTHERFSEEKVDFAGWILEAIRWRGKETVLDVGCGAGAYIDAVRQHTPGYIGGDLSLGMLRSLEQHDVARVNLDAQQLPFACGTVDIILANHMLYHVPDIDRALREFRRVLQPGGRLVAATNSAGNMAELEAVQKEALAQLQLPVPGSLRPNLTFTLENGAQLLSRHFEHVERRDLPGALVFPDPQPIIDYLASMHERVERLLPEHLEWSDVAGALHGVLREKIERHGEFRVRKLSGAFVCWND
ncbi:MAG TPA: class I SAM-dependent methyltransferase [Candidatus Binatia bacterium]|nr:class I SAM-dependent methyltransferase [Candidatus Binatia bacterium]